MSPGETILSGAPTHGIWEFEILVTPAGWYIGTKLDGMPYSRESEYLPTKWMAEALLESWMWRVDPEGDGNIAQLRREYDAGGLKGARR